MIVRWNISITVAFVCLLKVIQVSSVYQQPQQQQQQQQVQQPKSCGLYGQAPCTFVPAPPGMTPNCASPGKTFCEQNPDYPTHLIQNLVEKLGFRRILANEEQIDFNAHRQVEEEHHHHHYHHFYGPHITSSYGPPVTVKPATHEVYHYDLSKQQPQHYQQNDNSVTYDQKPASYPPVLAPQPIYIPKPQFSFNYNTYARAPISQQSTPSPAPSSGYFYPRPITPYSPAEWLRRFARDLSEKINSAKVNTDTQRQLDESPLSPLLGGSSSGMLMNETAYQRTVVRSRQKRQATPSRMELCQTREMYVTPQAALNTKGNWMYVVNHENSRQLVKAEICTSSECSNLCSLPNGYNSRCEQKFSQKRLLTLDADGNSLYVDTYWFPSCCVCTLANNS